MLDFNEDFVIFGGGRLVKYRGLSRDVRVPIGVTCISNQAFSETSIRSVELPSSIRTLEGFRFCASLVSVRIPATVTSIGEWDFKGCASLQSIEIPPSVTEIRSQAFSGCTSLKSIHIPGSVEWIAYDAFSGCTSLKSIEIDSSNSKYCSIDGVVYSKDGKEFVCCPGGKETLYIPDSVTEKMFFEGQSSLRSIEVDRKNPNYRSIDGVLYDKSGAKLVRCPGKKSSVNIPATVRTIGFRAFKSCSELKTVTFEKGSKLNSIEQEAFVGCQSLREFKMPSSVESIAAPLMDPFHNVFADCVSLESIEVGKNNAEYLSIDGCVYERHKDRPRLIFCPSGKHTLEIMDCDHVDDNAFNYCASLRKIKISKTLKKWGDCNFRLYDCLSLESFEVDCANHDYCSIDGVLYDKSVTKLIRCPPAKTYVDIPSSVLSIEDYAFYKCASLRSIRIPSQVCSIGERAFSHCVSLSYVDIPSKVSWIGGYAFEYCRSLRTVSFSNGSQLEEFDNGVFGDCESLRTINLPDSLRVIRNFAFSRCSSLKSIAIPANVLILGKYNDASSVFNGCKELEKIDVAQGNREFSSFDGALFDSNFEQLLLCPAGKTELALPRNTEKFDRNCLSGCYDLRVVNFQSNTACVDEFPFSDCPSLGYIEVGSTNSLYSSFDGALFDKSLTTLVHCPRGKNTLKIPARVVEIDNHALFSNSLLDIEVDSNNSTFRSIDGVLYNKELTMLICCPNGKSSIRIPESVTSINYEAFNDTTSLQTIVFEGGSKLKSVVDRGYYYESYSEFNFSVFKRCFSLESIELQAVDLGFASYDGVVYDNDLKTLLFFPLAKSVIEFPPTVVEIKTASPIRPIAAWIPRGVSQIKRYLPTGVVIIDDPEVLALPSGITSDFDRTKYRNKQAELAKKEIDEIRNQVSSIYKDSPVPSKTDVLSAKSYLKRIESSPMPTAASQAELDDTEAQLQILLQDIESKKQKILELQQEYESLGFFKGKQKKNLEVLIALAEEDVRGASDSLKLIMEDVKRIQETVMSEKRAIEVERKSNIASAKRKLADAMNKMDIELKDQKIQRKKMLKELEPRYKKALPIAKAYYANCHEIKEFSKL